MRKANFIISLFSILPVLLNAQISLQHTFSDMSAGITSLSDGSIKYYTMNVAGQQCLIYSDGFALEKTVDIPIPFGYTLYDIQYVTDNLFDTDDLIEMAITYYRYDTVALYWEYGGMVINENGTILLSMPGSGYLSLMQPTESSYQLFSWVYDYSVYPSTVDTKVYSLPGSWINTRTEELYSLKNPAWPVPANDHVNIPVPDNTSSAELLVFDMNGRQIRKIITQEGRSLVQLNVSQFAPGIYHYSLQSSDGMLSSGKFIKK